ncbi:hypothetical protein lerEdw1_016443 [Lerista edwardsae]|nr:hypothetical protein lerEdw1_016443 [Lerista edwardsae]
MERPPSLSSGHCFNLSTAVGAVAAMGQGGSKDLEPKRSLPSTQDQKERLHLLASQGHDDAAHCLLSLQKKALNKRDAYGRTPLFWATEFRHENLVELLLSHHADVTTRDHEGNTALHWAASVGSAPIAKMLLDAGADVNAQNDLGNTPLHLAVRERRYQCLILFLAHGAKVSLKNKAGQTPVRLARRHSPSRSTLKAVASRSTLTKASRVPSVTEKLLSRDISRGFERVPVPCLNGVDNEPCPSNFHYIAQDIISESLAIPVTEWVRRQHCTCSRICSANKCPCILRSYGYRYNRTGHVVETFNWWKHYSHIYECHVLCVCPRACPNRVVQRGLRTQLQLYRTPNKGWGVRTMQDLLRGTFICQYFGELICSADSQEREDDTYYYSVEGKDEQYYIDGRFYGNIGRFLNHACDPNVMALRVSVDHEIYGIAFFTDRAVHAGEELVFDYGHSYWEYKGPGACKCNSPKCRYPAGSSSLPEEEEEDPAPEAAESEPLLESPALEPPSQDALKMLVCSPPTDQASPQ